MRGIIVAVPARASEPSFESLSGGVIGVDGKIPWHYPGDLRRFKRVTMGAAIVMGRRTWESIGRPLPGRRNIVVTRAPIRVEGVETAPDVTSALARTDGPVWFVGGAGIYAEALGVADVLDVTFVPDAIDAHDAVRFPIVDARAWQPGPLLVHEDDERLLRRTFVPRRVAS